MSIPHRWQAAIADGRRFLARWGAQAERLGWTADDLFGLHEPPANPHPSYSRLARLDCAGLVWILSGRPVIALTGAAATIRATAGNADMATSEFRLGQLVKVIKETMLLS